jgi:uncharacterized membrane protein YcjF (UPF0283 family)
VTRALAAGDVGSTGSCPAHPRPLRYAETVRQSDWEWNMAEDAGDAALRHRRAARKYAIGFLALLLGSFVLAFMMTRIAPPEPRGGIDWAAAAALAAALAAACGALTTGLAAVANLILARQAEKQQARESDPALRQPAHQAREPGAKKPEQGSGA